MNILIDIDRLEREQVVSPELAQVLRQSALTDTGSTAINVLLAFGAVAIASGVLALALSAALASLIGAVFFGAGYVIAQKQAQQWGKLGHIWMVIGGLIFSGSLGYFIANPILTPLVIALLLGAIAVLARSHLLIALVPLALSAALGGRTGYWHATYMISVEEPTISILFFTALGLAAWGLARRRIGLEQALSLTFARVCVVLVNFGFWVGSLWGDTPGQFGYKSSAIAHAQLISTVSFSLAWAVALVLACAWGAKAGRRFMVNVAASFGAIHFYTQWFERLGATPWTIIIAGTLTIALALGFWRYNRHILEKSS